MQSCGRSRRGIAAAEQAHDGHRLAELHAHLQAIGGYEARSRGARLLDGLGFRPGEEERPVEAFSGGWRMRLNLGRALMCRSDLLLLDEPTNHLDLEAVVWLEDWLRAYRGTLLLISHDRDFLDGVCSHILHIEREQATLYAGNYSAFERIRAERLAGQQAAYAEQQREIAHIRRYVDRFRAKATKARQAQSRLKALERMELIAPAHVDSPFHFAFRAPERAPNPLLRLERADAGYEATVPVLRGANLTLSPGDRIGLLGVNGAGKSTLVKLLAGELAPLAGVREPARDLQVGYFAQHQLEQLRPEWTPVQHLLAQSPALARAGGEGLPRRLRLRRRPGTRARRALLRRREGAPGARADRAPPPEPAAARRAHQPPRPGDAPRARSGAAGLRGCDGAGVARSPSAALYGRPAVAGLWRARHRVSGQPGRLPAVARRAAAGRGDIRGRRRRRPHRGCPAGPAPQRCRGAQAPAAPAPGGGVAARGGWRS